MMPRPTTSSGVRRELEETLNRMTIEADEAVLRAGP
jgi:hypothetical protein